MEGVCDKGFIDFTTTQKIQKFTHEHTLAFRVTRVALDAIAVIAILVGATAAPFSVGLIISGVLLGLVVEVAFFALKAFGFLSVYDSNRPYIERSYEDSKLYYKDGIPFLEINAKTGKEAGFAHGYLASEGVMEMIKRMYLIIKLTSMGKYLDRIVSEKATLLISRFPAEYLEELEGVVEGTNKRKNESILGRLLPDVTLINLIALHYLPSLFTLEGQQIEEETPTFGCSTIIDTVSDNSPVIVGRNLDFETFGTLGRTSFVKIQKVGDGPKLKEIGFGGCIGTLTGINEETKMFVAMNVSGTHREPLKPENMVMPLMYNRILLERAKTAKEATTFDKIAGNPKPDGAYHLTVADPDEGFTVHYYQNRMLDEEKETLIRKGEKTPHITLNANYRKKYEPICDDEENSPDLKENCSNLDKEIYHETFFHDERTRNIETHFELSEAKTLSQRKERMQKALARPYVNNPLTMHSIVYYAGGLTMTKPDNGFASSNKWITV